jgi:hypothetical protein
MNTIIAYARKHYKEMRRNYLSTFAGLFLIAFCLPLAFRAMLGTTSEFGDEVLLCLAWASVLILTANAFREWCTEGYDSLCLTLPVSINSRFLFQAVSSLVLSMVATQFFFWLSYFAWEIFADFNCMVLIGDEPINIMHRLAITQVAIHSICCLCFARGGRSRTTSWVGFVAGFALFFFLLNLPEAAGWVSDSSSTFPNVENRMEIVGEHWQLSLPNRPLGNLTEFVQFLSGASIVGAFYVSAWLSLRERESLK